MSALHALNTASFERFLDVLRTLREATGNAEMQMQAMATFALIALRHPTEGPLGEIEKLLGMTQTSTSRNVSYLAKGDARGHGGYRLIEVFEDQFYRRRKLCKLTSKGREVAAEIAASFQHFGAAAREPHLVRAASGD